MSDAETERLRDNLEQSYAAYKNGTLNSLQWQRRQENLARPDKEHYRREIKAGAEP